MLVPHLPQEREDLRLAIDEIIGMLLEQNDWLMFWMIFLAPDNALHSCHSTSIFSSFTFSNS